MSTLKESLIQYLDAGFPIIYVNTFEEEKAESIVRTVIGGKTIMKWTPFSFTDEKEEIVEPGAGLEEILFQILEGNIFVDRKVLVLRGSHSYLKEPVIAEYLKQIAGKINSGDVDFNIIILSPVVVIPPELEKFTTLLTMDYLDLEDIKEIIRAFCQEQEIPALHPTFFNELALSLKGLSEFEIRNILALAISDDGEITRADLAIIFEQKRQMVEKSGILEMVPLKESLADIGGLENLKEWLKRKEKIFKHLDEAESFGVDIPKGVLITGLPGCGKSLSAKATAKLFEIPLLRLDMGKILGKYVGESEANMRRAIRLAEAISPCVLWIDEIEKAFSGVGRAGGESEVATRLFGTFLTWMQEKTAPAFVVATANDISKMPPEMLRKGRFDEIFYIGLPNKNERKMIFNIHIQKRRPDDLASIDVPALVSKTEGYSGADIEGVVRDAVESAFTSGKTNMVTEDILQSIRATRSLSVLMKDSIKKLKDIYEDRNFKNASK